MHVLRVRRLCGSGSGNGRHATQERTPTGLHANLESETAINVGGLRPQPDAVLEIENSSLLLTR
jgi:hypothetical protein